MSAFLADFLDFAVPVEMENLADLSPSVLLAIIRDARQVITEHGDIIQFQAPGTSSATSTLIRALAALALTADGGVTFAGKHWCRDHSRCDAAAL